MIKKPIAIILSVMMIVTSMFAASSAVFAETTSTDGFKSGDTVYFDCSVVIIGLVPMLQSILTLQNIQRQIMTVRTFPSLMLTKQNIIR